jgi:signal transduction histidine kinase
MEVVHHRCLAAPIGSGDGHQRRVAGQCLDIESKGVAAEPAADALEAGQCQHEGAVAARRIRLLTVFFVAHCNSPFQGTLCSKASHAHESLANDQGVNHRLRDACARQVAAVRSTLFHRPGTHRAEKVGDVSSRDLEPASSADSKEVGRGSGDSDAAQNESEARLRRSLLRATANNARLSSVALGFATLYVGWLAWRFADSRLLALALVVTGLATAIWRWSIAGMAAVDILPREDLERRFHGALDRNAYLVCCFWAPASLIVYPAITDKGHAVTYALCALGSMSVGSMYLLPGAHRGFWVLAGVQFASFLVATVFIETEHLWVTAFLLVLYAVAAYRISDQVRRTTRNLLRTHQVTDQLRHEAIEREQAMLVEAASAARSAELMATERQQVFMAKVGHEIRTPAQIIMADVEFLEHRLADSPELHLTLRRLHSAADLMAHQMQGIADYARSQSWRADDRLQLAQLSTVVADITNLHASTAGAKGLALKVAAQDVELLLDLGKVRQIVENLVGNAVKYTATGEVSVAAEVRSTATGPRELVIVVADTGIGIPEDVQDRVFEPFFKAAQSPARRDGLGLGLAIVKSLVTKLGGRIELQSRAGKGTTVVVSLPLAE